MGGWAHLMAYWLDDGFDTWPEVVRAGKAAAGLYVCCGAWIARSISNGSITEPVVPAEIATMYGTPEWSAKLVSVGLWSIEGAGYRDVRYHGMGNPTAEKAAKQRADKAARQQRWLDKQKETRLKTQSRRSRDASRDASKDDAPSLPPSKEGKGDARPASSGAARVPELAHSPPFHEPDQEPRNWKNGKAFGVVPDPVEADRARRGAAAARAGIRKPKRFEPKREPEDALAELGAAVTELADQGGTT